MKLIILIFNIWLIAFTNGNLNIKIFPWDWPSSCPAPDCLVEANRGILFPSPTLRYYFQCYFVDGAWKLETIECPCNTLFSFNDQRCSVSWDFSPHCDFAIGDPSVSECTTIAPSTDPPFTSETWTTTPPTSGLPNVPNTCPSPDCNVITNRGFLFPSRHLRFFYFCSPVSGGTWIFQIGECPCGHLFSFQTQKCEFPWAMTPHCRLDIGGDTSVVPC